uniref:Uncharacterized protein n=1 Tax=Candidatus Kentrum sp. FM TaxID=2126340 RepID=A0A450U3I2_9GAMM|nr:MAG: hypothetical protein BECKFM1743C_GA0114222_110192 [Candidatus Kentron sp. FM]
MRLPRALNLNENPAQFGIFFSANRLKDNGIPRFAHFFRVRKIAARKINSLHYGQFPITFKKAIPNIRAP